ncbi:MAG: AlbA family DNA-binding domain-containing protein, partial [Caulobacteraceae bacterium]
MTLSDVEALVTNAVAESRTLEFKAQLPGQKDEQKREFLYDVSALANTDGGDLIFGVEEAKGGVAKAVTGATLTEPLDATVRRLEQILASCVEPRLVGVRFRTFSLSKNTAVLLMRVPASFAAPHWARLGGTHRFYRRSSNSKAEMDIHELRT